MNGVDRFFKLYMAIEDYRWPGFAGYTLKDLLTTDVASNTNDGVFYEHRQEKTNDLWGLFSSANRTSVDYPTIAPTDQGEILDEWNYCVNGGVEPALDVNVDKDGRSEKVKGKIVIRRGPSNGGFDSCVSYGGIGKSSLFFRKSILLD